MQIGKFVGKESIPLTEEDSQICTKALEKTGLAPFKTDDSDSGVFIENIKHLEITSVRNHWSTMHRDRPFKAIGKKVMLFVRKQVGSIQTDEAFKYVSGSEGTIQYSASLSLYGDMHFKYQRGWSNGVEIYCYYDYDTDLDELLKRVVEYYNHLLKES